MDTREVIARAVKSLRQKTKSSSWWTKWIWYILAGSLGLLLVAFLVLEALAKGNKAAKALHQRDVLLEKKEQALVDAKVTILQKKKDAHVTKAEKHNKKALVAEGKAAKAKERAEKNTDLIRSLKDWDDAEKTVKY